MTLPQTSRVAWARPQGLGRGLVTALMLFISGAEARAQPVDFRRDLRPIFEKHCYGCHGPQKQKSSFRLDSKVRALKGGELGVAIVPGKSADSPLIAYVAATHKDIVMPPEGERLTAAQVDVLRRWIDQGANWPADADSAVKDKADHWAFKVPAARPAPPAVRGSAWVRNPVDAFVLAKLEEKGLTPSPEADRRTLLRRLSFDLTGLPPTPEEVEAYLADDAPDGYQKQVNRLLASPRYGERWARHWLDVAHYGETHGYDKDKPRENAWPYRDYVIRSLNADKSYGRYVEEQLAGDVLYPGDADGVIATGFIAAGPWDFVGHTELREGTVDKQITRSLDRDDMLMTVMSAFMSLTVHCARCHDHKFDPISQEDYYRLQAVFAGVDRGEREYAPGKNVYAAVPLAAARPIHLLVRGDAKRPAKDIGSGAVSAFTHSAAEFGAEGVEGARRAALAKWITHPGNLPMRRSIVNRVWHYHFGRGLVETTNDFGHMGAEPTHPELLDWLAYWFDENGQSLKKLHRLIVTSATYRQASGGDSGAAVDGDNRLLWRQNRQRLDAESIRDAMLAASGQIHLAMGGPSVKQFFFKDDHSPVYDYSRHDVDAPGNRRRSVYRFVVRSVPDPFMETLDCPDPSMITGTRNVTVTALQALSMLNNPFVLRQAEHLATRVEKISQPTHGRVEALYRLVLSRSPTPQEQKLMSQYAEKHGLANAARVLFNSAEFMFVD
jgi:mono/diheme cytochrome c family protein